MLILIFILSFFSQPVFAATSAVSAPGLAGRTENPLEQMGSVSFYNFMNFGFGPNNNGYQYNLNIQPFVPVSLNDDLNLIGLANLSIVRQPNLLGSGEISGLGDTDLGFLISPAKQDTLIWGVGPLFVLPTATNVQLGQGKYDVGPSLIALVMPGNWVLGFFATNVWSIGGQSNTPAVNSFILQYFINYSLPDGWFLMSQPVVTADWTQTQESGNRWTVPVGFGPGKVFNISKQMLSLSVQAYDNVVTPKDYGTTWQLQFNLTLLYP